MEIWEILERLGISDAQSVAPFTAEEDGRAYEVWRVHRSGGDCVLKKAKEYELSVYAGFFAGECQGAPRFIRSVQAEGADWFLMEYVSGESLCSCSRERLTRALDALMALQDRFWEDTRRAELGYTFAASLPGRIRRGESLQDPRLKQAYSQFLECYRSVPRTLCHDDLLPFNVLADRDSATLIDWEYGGLLPYLSSFARLIAHGQEREDYLFYMKETDRHFAVQYYYDGLLRGKGISWQTYIRDLKLFLLYEYCEWIMLGTNRELYDYYMSKAEELVSQL